MKEPAKPQNTHQAERKPPFFAREADSLKESASPEAPFFSAPAIQPKLKTGQPGDRYEQQADRVAERVIRHDAAHGEYDSGVETVQLQEEEEEPLQMMEEEEELQMQEEEEEPLQMMEEEEEIQMQEEEEEEPLQMMDEEEELQMQAEEEEELIQPKENNSVQKQEEEEEMLQMHEEEEEPLQMQQEEEEESLQMKKDHREAVVDEELSGQIKNAAGKGEPMPESTHERMSDAFGADFSNVKIHRDDAAVQMSRQLGAQAFTHGSDIYFNEGKYNPESHQGKRLLAHELTHVVQQNSDHKTPGVQGFFKKIKRGLKKAGRAIGRGARSLAGKVAKGTRKVIGATKRGLKTVGKGVRKIGNRVWGSIRKGGKKVWGWMKNTGNRVWGWMKKTGSKIWGGLKKAGKWIWNGIQWVGGKLWEKLKAIGLRAKRWITSLPARLKRLVLHLWKGVKSLKPWSLEWWKSLGKAETWKNFGLWLGELVIYYYEVLGIGEILETLADFIKFNSRPMTSTEETEAKKVFGDKINYSLVRIDEYSLIAWLGMKIKNADNMAVVTFHTVNFSRKIDAQKGTSDMAWLIHELVHVWQYERMGAMYMARATHAQNNAGYDYKGIDKLREKQSQGLDGFNLEQQGDIISDYYRILYMEDGLKPKWEESKNVDISVYKSYVDKL